MSERLTPCPSCARHVLVSEPACPFCREPLTLSASSLDPIRRPARRLGRAAIFAFGTTVTAAGCSATHTPTDGSVEMHDDAGFDAGSLAAAYGAPIDAGALDAGAAEADAGPDAG